MDASACSAARATAGAVLRPAGSSTISLCARSRARSCSATVKRWSSPHTSSGGRCSRPSSREQVSCSIVCWLFKGRNCLGYSCRESGHKREPEPPAIITGKIIAWGNPLIGELCAWEDWVAGALFGPAVPNLLSMALAYRRGHRDARRAIAGRVAFLINVLSTDISTVPAPGSASVAFRFLPGQGSIGNFPVDPSPHALDASVNIVSIGKTKPLRKWHQRGEAQAIDQE